MSLKKPAKDSYFRSLLREFANEVTAYHERFFLVPADEPQKARVQMWREGNRPVIGISVQTADEDKYVDFTASIEDFIEATEDCYECGNGSEAVLKDMKKLRNKLQERIDAMENAS